MKTKSKFLLFTLVLLLVCLSAVSASDNITDTSQSGTDEGISVTTTVDTTNVVKTTTTDAVKDTAISSAEEINQNKTINKKIDNDNNIKEAGRTLTINSKTYSNFFTVNGTSNLVSAGDILNLTGNFENVNFTIDKKITLTSLNKDAYLHNCKVTVKANGSTVSNLEIVNNASQTSGIILDHVNNILVENNDVRVNGTYAHAFDAVTNRSTIKSNYFQTTTTTPSGERTHTAMVFCSSWYNNIQNNTVLSDAANGIYLSNTPGQSGLGSGGPSYYNNITGNTVYGGNTGWSYTIQMMGSNNIASYNTVSGGYYGISSAGSNIIEYNDIDAWNRGVSTGSSNIVSNNNIHVSGNSLGVYVDGKNNTIISNNINTNSDAIIITNNDTNITNNTIVSSNGYGIYAKPNMITMSGIYIAYNDITSYKEGILLVNANSFYYINNIYVDHNTIISSGTYAINLKNVGPLSASDLNVTVTSSNVLKSSNGTGTAAYLPPSKSNGTTEFDTNQVIYIRNLTDYNNYFENGVAKSTVLQNATVYISGTYNGIDFKFPKKVHIIGQNCIINNGTITLSENAHASSINGVKIKNTKDDYTVHAIELLDVNNCILTNNTIENYGKYESLGIFVCSSNGNTIKSNNIKTSGDYVNNGIMLYLSSINTIEDNVITINQSNVSYSYSNEVQFNERVGTQQEVLHCHGIMLLGASTNTINKNKVTVTSMFKSYISPSKDCQNSIVGIDIYFQSNNNIVTNNVINMDSYGPFTYGMGVLGGQWGKDITESSSSNNKFQNNNVTVKGGYFATGFIAGRNSVNTTLESNNFNIDARKSSNVKGDYAYGITLENSTTSTISKNNIAISGAAVYSMELYSSDNNNITYNTITTNGYYPYGIAGGYSSNNNMTYNTITIIKNGTGSVNSALHADAIPWGYDGIYFMYLSNNNLITYNTIKTNTNNTVNFTKDTYNNTVTENSLVASKTTGDNSANAGSSTNKVYNNFIYFVNATVDPVTAIIGDTIVVTAHVNTTTTDYSNLTVTFKIGANTIIGTSNVTKGKASVNYQVPTLFNPTVYQLTASVSGTNFQNTTAISQATFTKEPESINVNVNKVSVVAGCNATLTANITTSTGGKIGSGTADFYVGNVKVGSSDVKLGSASVNYPTSSTPGVYVVTVKYLGTSDYASSTGNSTLCLQSTSDVTISDVTSKLGNSVTLKATVTSNGKVVSSGKVKYYIGSTLIGTADISSGVASYKYTIPSSYDKGTYTLKAVFDGNDTLTSSSATSKITINPYTSVFTYSTTKAVVGNNVSLVLGVSNGLNGSSLVNASGGSVSILLNGVALTDSNNKVITGNVVNGKVVFTFVAPSQLVGSQNVSFNYTGNSKFSELYSTYNYGLIIAANMKNTKITLNKIATATVGSTVNITGTLTDAESNKLKNTGVQVTINGKSVSVKTNSEGIFTVTTGSGVVGINNVTASYLGNGMYNASTAKTTFTLNKKATKIVINTINSVEFGNTLTITGTFSDADGKIFANTNVNVTLNGKTISVKTNSKGVFTITTKTTKPINTTVKVSYTGTSYYSGSSATKAYSVTSRSTKITINTITKVESGKNLTITGTFTDSLGNKFIRTTLKGTLNGNSFTVKTDNNGIFTITSKTNKPMNGTVVVFFNGNANYKASTDNKTYSVDSRSTNIVIKDITKSEYGSNVTITGTFTDALGNKFSSSTLKATVNGKACTTKTDANGVFTIVARASTIGTNNVTVYFTGNANYKSTTSNKTFSVVSTSTKITINSIGNVKQNSNLTITGKFMDKNNNLIVNTGLSANLNGKTFTVKTDSKGVFKITTRATVLGTNNLTVTYAGSQYYQTTTATTKYVVKS